ncbi:MAG: PaaI family thioesterase [Rhodospirillales bacterium]
MKRPPAQPDLERIIKIFEKIPHCRAMAMKIVDLRHGKGFMCIDYSKRLVGNPETRVVHGGVITALFDTVGGLAVMSAVAENTPIATLDLRIDYLRPATPGERILASAECYRVTDDVAFVRGLAYHDVDGDPIANCTSTYMLAATGFAPKASGAGTEEGRRC